MTKKEELTQGKAKQAPAGGVVVGKRKGQTMIYDDASSGGFFVGRTHAEGGIDVLNKSTGQTLEVQGAEVIITAPAVADQTKRNFDGKMMTNREILSTINERGGGVSFADGGDVPKSIKHLGEKYSYGGKTMTDYEIMQKMNGGLIAPNGKHSNLTVEQYKLVRTPEFKAWFGDWENDPENASKVVDENGEPLMVFHGTNRDFDVFDERYIGTSNDRGFYGKGFYFTFQSEFKNIKYAVNEALYYGKKLLTCYVKAINPFDFSILSMYKNKKINYIGAESLVFLNNISILFPQIADKIFIEKNTWNKFTQEYDVEELSISILPNLVTKYANDLKLIETQGQFDIKETMGYVKSELVKYEYTDKNGKQVSDQYVSYDDLGRVQSEISKEEKEILFIELAIEKYEGISFRFQPEGYMTRNSIITDAIKEKHDCILQSNFGDELVVFNSNQIKLADGTNTTFDDKNPDIRFKKGGYMKDDLVDDSIKGNHPSRDLNNYNDILDVSGDAMIGADSGFFVDGGKIEGLEVGTILVDNDDLEYHTKLYRILDINEKQFEISVIEYGKERDSYMLPIKMLNDFQLANEEEIEDYKKFKDNYDNDEFKNGGNLDFLEDVKTIFDEGGSTELPIASYFIVSSTGSSLSKLKGVRYDSYNEFVESVEQAYKDIGRKVRSNLSFKVYDKNDFFLMNLYTSISDQKNTVKNFNPFTGNSNNLKKVFLNNYPYSFIRYNWDEWFSFKRSKSAKSEPTSQSETKAETKSKEKTEISRVEVIYSVGKESSKTFVVRYYTELISVLKEALDKGAYMTNLAIYAEGKTTNISDYGLGVTKNPTKEFELNPFIITKEDFRKKVFDKLEKKDYSADYFFDTNSKEESNSNKPKVTYLSDDENEAKIGNLRGLLSYILKLSGKGKKEVFLTIIADSKDTKKSFYLSFGLDRDSKDARYINIFGDTEALKKSIFGTADNLQYDWKDFFEDGANEESKQDEKPIRNFELEKKYLIERINALSSELDLKRPILNNDEVAFYQREINKFVSKLRKVSNDEMELKPLQARINDVYKVKWGDYEKEYPECDLKSINGIKSELTFEEYLTVRTPEFMSFFGNWQQAYLDNTYSGTSKIINPKTKEPMPVFHGTNVLFTEWKTYDTNNAHYFAVKRDMSDFFASSWESRTDKAGVDSKAIKALNPNTGKFLYRCFLDVRNPIDFSKFGVEKRTIKEFLLFLKINYNIGDYDFWTNLGKASGFTNETKVYAWQIIRLWQNFTQYIKLYTTYDGYIFYEYIPNTAYGGLENASLSFCAFESNQIKFVDAYEFNALSNDSRFDFGGKL